MSITSVDGQLVHYEAFGRGKPVIFVHGWLGSWRYWWSTMQALSSHHRSFAVDLWGFGDSSKTGGDFTLESHLGMLEGFIDKLGIARPFTLVGHSLGAALALRYAKETPRSVNRIATIAMPITKDHVNGHLLGRTATSLIDQSKNRFNSFPEVVMGLEKADLAAVHQSVGQIGRLTVAEDLLAVECPVLLVFGDRDTLIKQPAGELDKERQNGSNRRCVSVEKCGHYPMLEQPAVFNRLLKEFIDHSDPSNLEPKNYWQRRTR